MKRQRNSREKAGFTLPELLTVICIISILMASSFGALMRARALAKQVKASTQLRELVNAYTQYYITYNAWPSGLANVQDKDLTEDDIRPLFDPTMNPNGIIFLKYNPTAMNRGFLDPWKRSYRVSFGAEGSARGGDRGKNVIQTTVALPKRYIPE